MEHWRHIVQSQWQACSNRYDHLDRRVQKITPAATHTYFYDGWMLIGGTQEQTDIGGAHNGKMYLREDRGDA